MKAKLAEYGFSKYEDQSLAVQNTYQIFSPKTIQQQQFISIDQTKNSYLLRDNLDQYQKLIKMIAILLKLQIKNKKYTNPISTFGLGMEIFYFLNQKPTNSKKDYLEKNIMIYKQLQTLVLQILKEQDMENLIRLSTYCYIKFYYLALLNFLKYQARLAYQEIVKLDTLLEILIKNEFERGCKQQCKTVLQGQKKMNYFYRTQSKEYVLKDLEVVNKEQDFSQAKIIFERESLAKKSYQKFCLSSTKYIQKDINSIQISSYIQHGKITFIPFIKSQQLSKNAYQQNQKDKLEQFQEENHSFENKSNRSYYSYFQIEIAGQLIILHLSQSQQQHLLNLIAKKNISQLKSKINSLAWKQKNVYNSKINTQNKGFIFGDNKSQKFLNMHEISISSMSNKKINSNVQNNSHKKLKVQRNYLVNFDNSIQQTISNQQQHYLYSKQNLYQIQLSDKKNILKANKQQKFQYLISNLDEKILGGGICGSNARVISIDKIPKKDQQVQQIMNEKQYLMEKFQVYTEKDELDDDEQSFKKFNKSYDEYFTTAKVSEKVIETDVRLIIEETLYRYREQIVQQDIRHKVIDIINLLINYLLIIKQNNLKQSIQSDIDQINQYLQKLSLYCKENRERYPCLDLYQYTEILITLNSQRQGLDSFNQSFPYKIMKKMVQVAKFGAGFVSIAGAIKNLTEINFDDIKNFINEIQQIADQIMSDSSTGAVNSTIDTYTDYNTSNLANNLQALWVKKLKVMGQNLLQNDPIQDILFYLEESMNITNKDTLLFVYMQLNYLLSKQQLSDNLQELTKKLKQTKKIELILKLANILQVKEFSDSIVDKLKNIASLIAQSHQFRYIKAQLLLYFAQILKTSNQSKGQFDEIMISVVSNYLQEKQKSVKIIYEGNQIMADFIHNHLDKKQILNQINEFKKQMTKHLNDEQLYSNFANEIQNESDIDKQLAIYFVEMWELSVKQRQKNLQITHKDDALLEAIYLYVKQQITYEDGFKIDTQEKDAVKQIINQFLIPNYVDSSNNIQGQQPNQNKSSCKIISVLAEGGSGKSMLLKKLEVELLNRSSQYTSDNKSDYIPFIIKCNSLDNEQPSIEKYLESISIKREDIERLKKSERNKLIMLDGFDEYSGDYFKVFKVLKLYEWVNTLTIVTSRLEKITVSDAKVYFNYYDQHGNQGQNDSFAILKLEKITENDIQDYFKLFKNKIRKDEQLSFNEFYYDKIQQTIFKNKQLLELLKLPINLYLTTRMMNDLDLNNQDTLSTFEAATGQVEIQEFFFQQQFKKQSQIFIQKQQKVLKKQDQELIKNIQSCYFEYFHCIAMKMFLQKGKKSNFLSITKDSIKFQLRDEIQTLLKKNEIEIEELKQEILNYVDSRVITRIKLTFEDENSQKSQEQKASSEEQSPQFEFRHKSLFEYFAARAMKYDFDLHKEDIFKLDLSQLKNFSINKKIIMSSQKNASEQQILLKLYKLMKPYLDSQSFMQTYSESDISQTNRYIQFLKKSQISKYTEKSEIDIGSSNLLSALFISKFSFPNLTFKQCSFSQAYLSSHSRKVAQFEDCNFENSLIEKQYLDHFETSNTKNAILSAFQKYFDTDNSYQFNQVIFHNNTLVSITKTGYINQFEIDHNTNQPCKILLSNQITNSSLSSIDYVNKKNIFVITANKSIFEIDAKSFERVNCFTFQKAIASFSTHHQKYLITLINNQIHYGDIENGFTMLDKAKIEAVQSLLINDLIITSSNNQIKVYNLPTLSLVKTIEDSYNNLSISSFSADGKYLALSYQNESCQIFSLEKGFEAINLIQGYNLRASSITFSADSKYLAIGSDNCFCKIFNVEKGFELLHTIKGHFETINSVSFSTDGKYFATSSEDNNCKVWNTEKEFQLIHTLQGHSRWVTSVSFSADGKHFATSSADKTCKLWKIGKKIELIHVFSDYEQNITTVNFSTNGKYLAIGSSDSACKIWNIEKEFKLISTIEGDTFEITSIAFSADDKYLAFSLEDGTFKISSVDNAFKIINTIKGHNQTINSIAFSTNGKYLATGSVDFTCKIWSVKNEFKLVNIIQKHAEMITQVTFSADCKYLVTSSKDITCKIFNVEKGFDLINSLSGHTQTITSVAFSKNGKYLATGSDDNTLNVWSVEKGFELINKIQEHTWSVLTISFSADSKHIITGSKDTTCKIWNIEKGFEFISSLKGHTQAITSVTFSKDGKYLATGSEDKTYQVWNVKQGFEIISQIQAHNSPVTSVAFSADSKYLATGSEDNTCKVWNIENGFELISKIETHIWYITSVAFSPDNKYLITGSFDSTFKIWNVQKSFKQYKSIEAQYKVTSVAFSADGKYLATGTEGHTCKIWNVIKGFKLIHTIQCNHFIKSVAFSADGKYLATGSYDKTCKVWNALKNFELIYTIEGHTLIVTSVAFSADGKYLATCSYDKTCKIWSLEKQFQLINLIQNHTDYVTAVSFSMDGKYLATGSQDNTCKIINVQRGFEILSKIQGETQEITSVAYSEDGKYLATGSEDKICKIWDIEKGYKLIDEMSMNFKRLNQNTFEITIKEQNNNLTITFKNQTIFEQIYEV